MDLSWLCPVPGSDPATMAWHGALMLGLAGFVVVGGATFLVLAVLAYRRPAAAAPLGPAPVALAPRVAAD
jgi:hypothetical protein